MTKGVPDGSERWLIVGLGNPGERYAHTRHNLGFWAVDSLAVLSVADGWQRRDAMLVATCRIRDEAVVLVKPLSWMNLSGQVVLDALSEWPTHPERLVVVCDDVALPDCRIRIRLGGSSGGHKGVASIIDVVGFDRFVRVRIGVGSERTPDDDLSEFVLRPLTDDQIRRFSVATTVAARLIAEGIAKKGFLPTTVDVVPSGEALSSDDDGVGLSVP